MVARKRNVVDSFPQKKEFMKAVNECYAKAITILGCENMPHPDIIFYKKSQTAGLFQWRKDSYGIDYYLQFNVDAIQNNFEDMVNETIPHEMAHMVDFFIHQKTYANKPKMPHGHTWKRYCVILGGNGARTHKMELPKGKRTQKFLYIGSCGTEIWVGKNIHNKIQIHNLSRIIKKTKGRIDRNSFANKSKMD